LGFIDCGKNKKKRPIIVLIVSLMFVAALSRRNRVIAATAPRIATQDAFGREKSAVKQTVRLDGLKSIARTAWLIAAHRWRERGNGGLVKPNQQQERELHYFR